MPDASAPFKRLLHHGRRYSHAVSTPAERLKQARQRAGYTEAKAAAEAMGVVVSTYIQHENGTRGFPPGRAERYAKFFRTTPQWLLYGHGDAPDGTRPTLTGMRPISREVPVLGVVQAGVWTEIPNDEQEPEEFLPISLSGFEGAQLYALRVQGPSMNRVYADGTMVVVCPATEIGVREGDHVVVRRRRGSLIETTLKEIVKEKRGGYALWPRSTDALHQEPIRIEDARDADEGPEIIGVVVASYAIRPMQQRPMVRL